MSGWWNVDLIKIKKAYSKLKIPSRKCFSCENMITPEEVQYYKMFPWKEMPTYELNGKNIHYMNLFVLCKECPKIDIISPETAIAHQTGAPKIREVLEQEKMNKDLNKKLSDLIDQNNAIICQYESLNIRSEELMKKKNDVNNYIKERQAQIKQLNNILNPLNDALEAVQKNVEDILEESQKNIIGHICGICLSSMESNIFAIVPCGHTYCSDCINKLRTCGVCRGPINMKLQLYF